MKSENPVIKAAAISEVGLNVAYLMRYSSRGNSPLFAKKEQGEEKRKKICSRTFLFTQLIYKMFTKTAKMAQILGIISVYGDL